MLSQPAAYLKREMSGGSFKINGFKKLDSELSSWNFKFLTKLFGCENFLENFFFKILILESF